MQRVRQQLAAVAMRRRHSTIATAALNAKNTKPQLTAEVTFLGHTAPLLDAYVSFARQAAQAMAIRPSKTIFPVRTTPDVPFCPDSYPAKSDLEGSAGDDGTTNTAHTEMKNTRGLSFTVDRWTVNRSPFVHGRHQDQFEIRTYQRRLELFDAHPETVRRWLHYCAMNLPASVGLEYVVHTEEQVDLNLTSSEVPAASAKADSPSAPQ